MAPTALPTIRTNQRSRGDDVFASSAHEVERCVTACQLELIEAPLLTLSDDVALPRAETMDRMMNT